MGGALGEAETKFLLLTSLKLESYVQPSGSQIVRTPGALTHCTKSKVALH